MRGVWVLRLVCCLVVAMTGERSIADEPERWRNTTANQLLKTLEAIGVEGNLRNGDLPRRILGVSLEPQTFQFPSRATLLSYDATKRYGPFIETSFSLEIVTGNIAYILYGRPLIAAIIFRNLQNYVCVRLRDFENIFQSKYVQIDSRYELDPHIGYTLFITENYSIKIEASMPIDREGCISQLLLAQSRWTCSIPRDGTYP